MESNYKVAYKSEWSKLKKLEPLDISKRLDVKYNQESRQFIVSFLNEDYILDCKTETIYRKIDKYEPVIDDSIIILNYLTYSAENINKSNKWVSLKEIPNGGALFYPAFYNAAIRSIITTFGHDINEFDKRALNLGGKDIKLGDKGYEFKILPKISICIAIWEGDDEISPNATILYNPSIAHLVHIETVIGIGYSICNKLVN